MDAVNRKHHVDLLCVFSDPGSERGGDGEHSESDSAGSQGSDGGDTGDIGGGEDGVGGKGDGSSAATLGVTLFTTVLAVSIAKTT